MVTFLVGVVVGVGLTVAVMLMAFKVQTKEAWEAAYLFVAGVHSRGRALAAENAKLRVALAAGEMTEEGKRIAKTTQIALDAVIAADKAAIDDEKPSGESIQRGQ